MSTAGEYHTDGRSDDDKDDKELIIMASEVQVEGLAYLDIQHDALAVFDDVEQGIVAFEDIWVSAYQAGSSSVHGKAKVSLREGGGTEITSLQKDMTIEQVSRTHFEVTVPSLNISRRSIRFPKQVIHPDYKKSSSLDAPLQINALALNPKSPHVVIGGPDGFCSIIPTSVDGRGKEVRLKGHVGDVRDVRWFPSGEVILTASSDLSVRVYGKDGINPRSFRGHTRAVTSLHIIGVGKQVLSGSKDGTVRLWDVGKGVEVRKWMIGDTVRRGVEGMIVLPSKHLTSLRLEENAEAGGEGEEQTFLLNVQEGVWVQPWDAEGWMVDTSSTGQLVSFDQRDGVVVLGYTNGIVEIRDLSTFAKPESETSLVSGAEPTAVALGVNGGSGTGRIKRTRRNEASIYSLRLASPDALAGNTEEWDLYMGTAAGLPCVLRVTRAKGEFTVQVREELGGWDAVGVESWDVKGKEVWCAGGEGGIRRF